MEFVYNSLQSVYSAKDYKLVEHIASGPIKESVDLRNKLQPIRNQGKTDTCCAHAGCVIKEYPTDFCYFSPAFIYSHRENVPAKGMYGRDMMSILLNKGVCPEENYPIMMYNKNEAQIPSESINKIASSYKIAKYYAVTTQEELKQAISLNGPCLILFPVFNNSKYFWRKENPSQGQMGGHAVAIVGYHPTDGFLIRNSWGVTWGEMGYTWYPYSDWGSHWEIWGAEDLPSKNPKINPSNCLLALCFC